MRIAIYDLDRTITKLPTFTPFLVFAAQRRAPWRLILAPLWVGAMLGYKARIFTRKQIKQFGIALFVGRRTSRVAIDGLAADYVDTIIPNGLLPGAVKAIAQDRAEGFRLVLATAAPQFYAAEIGRRLGFDHVIATRHVMLADGTISNLIDGENCYGVVKFAMVQAYLEQSGIARESARVRFYSDHASDAPLFDWADKAVFVTRGTSAAGNPRSWIVQDWR